MATSVQDATEFGRFFAFAYFLRIASLDVDAQLFLQDVNLLVQCQLLPTEYPGAAEGGTANHDSINAVGVKGTVGIAERLDVAIADDGYMDARIPFDFTYQRPVGLTRVHLASGSSVNGQCLDTAVLQLFGQRGDAELFVVPAQTRLGGHRHSDGIDHLAGNLQQLGIGVDAAVG